MGSIKVLYKKYKTIKEYPDGPKLGEIIDSSEISWNPEDFPNYFTEVGLNYEVLIFKDTKNKHSYTPKSLNMTMEECLNDNNLTIFKVKRLSDGEIFTIGDKVKFINRNITTILSFKSLPFNVLKIKGYEIGNNTWSIENLKKIDKPLFTTDDNVDVYEGDKVFYVYNNLIPSNLKGLVTQWEILTNNDIKANITKCKYYKIFARKESAINYIFRNKPLLSLKDIEDLSSPYHRGRVKGKKASQVTFKYKKFKILQLIKDRLK